MDGQGEQQNNVLNSGPAGPGFGVRTILDYTNDNCNLHSSPLPLLWAEMFITMFIHILRVVK